MENELKLHKHTNYNNNNAQMTLYNLFVNSLPPEKIVLFVRKPKFNYICYTNLDIVKFFTIIPI